MTDIEIVNAINSAIADGRKVKAKVKTDDVINLARRCKTHITQIV